MQAANPSGTAHSNSTRINERRQLPAFNFVSNDRRENGGEDNVRISKNVCSMYNAYVPASA